MRRAAHAKDFEVPISVAQNMHLDTRSSWNRGKSDAIYYRLPGQGILRLGCTDFGKRRRHLLCASLRDESRSQVSLQGRYERTGTQVDGEYRVVVNFSVSL